MKHFKNICTTVNDGWKWWIVTKYECTLRKKIKIMWQMFIWKDEYLPINRNATVKRQYTLYTYYLNAA